MNKLRQLLFPASCFLLFTSPAQNVSQSTPAPGIHVASGKILATRFLPPSGYSRVHVSSGSFAEYLRLLPLKPAGSYVKYYDGEIKYNIVYDAVVDMDIGKRDLQQCADAVMRLRGEYFYSREMFDSISFTLTNGFKVPYSTWMKGNRVAVEGNRTWWVKKAAPSNTYQDFRNYMEFVFNYAGTASLSKMLRPQKLLDIKPGDVFIVGGFPGHAVIVTDVAVNKTGEKVFMLAQSYMPAQDIQVLKNPNSPPISPWYSTNINGMLHTPQWAFETDQLMTW